MFNAILRAGFIFLLVSPSHLIASTSEEDALPIETNSTDFFKVQRNFRLGLSSAQFVWEPFEKPAGQGLGLAGYYEVAISPVSTYSIYLGYRQYSGEQRIRQLVYGLVMKHHIRNFETTSFSHRLCYGLLLQVLNHAERRGNGTAHDTRSSWEVSFGQQRKWYVELGWNFSQLRYFDVPVINAHYVELSLGRFFHRP